MSLFWRSFRRNRLAAIGGVIVLVLIALAVFAPLLAPWDPHRPDIKKILADPSRAHPLGTDQLGRDVLSRMLYGARVSLAVGFVSVGIATVIGIALGAAAGYHGGYVDGAIMRLVDLMLVFPRFFLLLAVLAFLRPSIWTIMAVIGLTGWMGVTRLVRAEFLALKEREFVIWSQAVGASGFRVVWRHILPNALAPVLVAMTLGIPAAILTESGLSFLGLGVQPPYATWGNILNEGKDTIEIGWWLSFYPGVAILITVLSYNLLGEGIRDALDPRLRQAVGRIVTRGG
ncbi:MAG: ABC transporter permease [Candidatus Rokubacteria bacterium]|nr:ABC transporter permease [Candidatus Rokubacteria bacterium]